MEYSFTLFENVSLLIGLVNKLTGQQLDRIRLGWRTKLKPLGRRTEESEESPVRQEEETVGRMCIRRNELTEIVRVS